MAESKHEFDAEILRQMVKEEMEKELDEYSKANDPKQLKARDLYYRLKGRRLRGGR